MRVVPGGLAEKKMLRTRKDLARAAAVLFLERGYEATTVEDIAAAAEVSPRTFYRYFRAKEDLVLALGESRNEALLKALRDRPASEAPLTAVMAAVVEAYDLSQDDPSQVARFRALVRGTPALWARWLVERDDFQEEMAVVLAGREGVKSSVRHLAAAAAVVAAITAAREAWVDGRNGDLRTLVFENLALLGSPLLSTESASRPTGRS